MVSLKFSHICQRVDDYLSSVPTLALASLFLLIVFLHNPNALLHAEFWGEDGLVWYGQAYASGAESLLRPEGGYLNSLQRLPALAAQGLSLAIIPRFFVLFAIIVQALPAIFLVSRRMVEAWPNRASRVLFAFLFVMMPNAPETALTLTNSQWYLAILAFLIIVSSVPRSIRSAMFDSTVLLISGLSGPFGILFVPIAFFRTIKCAPSEKRARVLRLFILAATAFVQALLILGLSHQGRVSGPLGATPELLVKILAMIPLGAEVGYNGVYIILNSFLWHGALVASLIVSLSGMLFFTAVSKGPRILKEFTFFAAVMFVLALCKPLMSMTDPQWPRFMMQPAGNRYFLYPMLAWWGALFVLTAAHSRASKLTGSALLALTMIIAVPIDWGDVFGYGQTDFVARARQFEGAQIGTVGHFDIHPPGFTMLLTQERSPRINEARPVDPGWLAAAAPQSQNCNLETINQGTLEQVSSVPRSASMSMVGWALFSHGQKPREVVAVFQGPQDYAFTASHGVFRDDVVSAIHGASREGGFASTVAISSLRPGRYKVQVMMMRRNGFERCDTGKTLIIPADSTGL